ncbi:hypothetical protein PV325_007328 [Microctonus aethiopoides]|nr:hypothetical protein PV325_007328 [Microctonus aethiopoides]
MTLIFIFSQTGRCGPGRVGLYRGLSVKPPGLKMMMLSARGPAPTTDAHLAASLSVAVRRLAVSESAHPRL